MRVLRLLAMALVILVLVRCASSTDHSSVPSVGPFAESTPGPESIGQTSHPAERYLASSKVKYAFNPADRSCDGFPRLPVGTMPGSCLGMVLSPEQASSDSKPWKMPRTITKIPNTKDFFVVDMYGWGTAQGAIYLLRQKSDGRYENILVKDHLRMPHALKFGPDGFFYLGETDRISRFHFDDGKIRDWELVADKFRRLKDHSHPLVAIAFDPRNGDLYFNSGSPSDHCFTDAGNGAFNDCALPKTSELAGILKIPAARLKNIPAGGIPYSSIGAVAHGLRNSMGMVISPAGQLVQGENGRDFRQFEEPFEEMNVIDLNGTLGAHYGWPYCYDFHAASPEVLKSGRNFQNGVNCANKSANGPGTYQPPYILMPPHASPLYYNYYQSGGQFANELRGKLLAVWHGYNPTGHRLVAYTVDARGLPELKTVEKPTYSIDASNGCSTQTPFRPQGGLDRFAPYTELISQWGEVAGVRPVGTPVSFEVADDGSIFIVEDKNRTIVRLARSDAPAQNSCGGDQPRNTSDPRIELLAWRAAMEANPSAKASYGKIRDTVLKKYCASCHFAQGDKPAPRGFMETEIATDDYSELDYLVKKGFLTPGDSLASKLYQALAHTGEVPAMPPPDVAFPEGEEGAALVNSVKAWINSLPQDIDASRKKTAMKSARKIRQEPSTGGKECGSVGPGDVVYIDPRPGSQISHDGWSWTKAYFVPGDSRLTKGACAYPVDGVFYIATVKL